jgi:hypothetical protein
MRNHFLAIHPLIGTKHKPSALHLQQRSPYYWWWAYLRRNEEYWRCCELGGTGLLAELYADFGDVRSDDFPAWWGRSTQRGSLLFAEKPAELKLQKLETPADWLTEWQGKGDVMVVAVNMTIGKRKLQSYLATLLQKEHKGRRGRVALGKVASTAKYPLCRNFTVHSLKQTLATYDAWLANQLLPKAEQRPLWAVGESLKSLVPSAMPAKGDIAGDRNVKHNIMTVAVSRYVKQAKAIIANTALGKFP